MKLQVLRLVFPNARISVLPARPDEKPWPVTDPANRVIAFVKNELKSGQGYIVTGPAAKNEENAASDVADSGRPPSNKRQLWMQLFHWRTSDSPLLVAVLSYSFLNVNPGRCCRVIGRILLLSSTADRVLDSFDQTPHAFTEFESLRFFRADETGVEDLMIGADFSGPGTTGISSIILDVSHRRLKLLLSVSTLILYEITDVHTLTLDERRTLLAQGKRVFFIQKSYVEKGKVLRKPVTTGVAFPAGTGLPLDWF